MRKCLIALLSLGMANAWSADLDTAYSALRAVKERRGEQVMSRLLRVSGEAGDAQPDYWIILARDPEARGGVREFSVERGIVTGERTPVRGSWRDESPINFSQLNVDSDGAFRIANKEAVRKGAGFHTIDYLLRQAKAGEGPIWVVRLHDYMGAPVGRMTISARDGRVIEGLYLEPDLQERAQADFESIREAWNEGGGLVGNAKSIFEKTKDTVTKGAKTVAGTVEEFVTGDRTIDQE